MIKIGKKGGLYYKGGQLIEEKTEGRKSMRFLYKTWFGFLVLMLCIRRFPAWLYGRWKSSKYSKKGIRPFIAKHAIDVSEFEKPVQDFTSFNDFFIRKLKRGVRTINRDSNVVASPCDGKVVAVPNITEKAEFFIKGKPFSLNRLFQDDYLAQKYEGGALLLFRLAPYDYHRYHFPVDVESVQEKRIPGVYHSVNPLVYSVGIQPLTVNERRLVMLETNEFGSVALFSIGAMFVGTIVHTYPAQQAYKKGDEMGYFAFGGSSLVMVFAKDIVSIDGEIVQHSQQGYETAVNVGQLVARRKGDDADFSFIDFF